MGAVIVISRLLCAGLGLLCVAVLSPAMAGEDRLLMKNGSVIIGKLISADADRVRFGTPFAGDISIRQANILQIVTANEVDLLLKDGRLYREKRIVAQEESLVVLSREDEPVVFDVPDIRMVNPEPWRLGLGYKWTGRAEGAFESERGNSDTDELDLNLESIWRGLHDRYTARGIFEVDETNNQRNKYRWLVRTKYDRFSEDDPDNYIGLQAAWERDEFQDIDLRTTVGPYLGRQFFEAAFMQLYGELGVVFVEEQFDIANNTDYLGLNWEVRWAIEPLAGYQVYVNQEGVVGVGDRGSTLLNTILGIRFPTLFGFAASAEAVYEYDSGAVEQVDTTDETYRIKIGYIW